jgi:fused signal recognition particle receptor
MEEREAKGGFFQKLKEGLAKTRNAIVNNMESLFSGRPPADEELLAGLEELLVAADVGAVFAEKLTQKLKAGGRGNNRLDAAGLQQLMKELIEEILAPCARPLVILPPGPTVVMVVGVNGTGKTSTIGKIANDLKEEGRKVMLVAADTFRAAAIEQLEVWSKRAGADLVKQHPQADPAAVIFDALKKATSLKPDVILVDTAGRLHTKTNLMEELKKMKRVMGRELAGAPHEVLLVLDATSGQNALHQVRMFHQEVGVTGLVITKLDSTAKGGIIIRIASEFSLPIRYIGVGETLADLRRFESSPFTEALFQAK